MKGLGVKFLQRAVGRGRVGDVKYLEYFNQFNLISRVVMPVDDGPKSIDERRLRGTVRFQRALDAANQIHELTRAKRAPGSSHLQS